MSTTQQSAVQAAQVKRTAERQQGTSSYFLRSFNNGLITALVVAIALLWSVPTFGLFISSFRPPQLLATTGWWTGLFPPWRFTIQNYEQVINAQGMGQAFLNSLIISIPGTILPVLFGAFAAFAFSWMKFPLRNTLFFAIVALLVVPGQIALAPIYALLTQLGLTGTYIAIWLAFRRAPPRSDGIGLCRRRLQFPRVLDHHSAPVGTGPGVTDYLPVYVGVERPAERPDLPGWQPPGRTHDIGSG